ncbi:MAG TPA: hypothetical protein VFA45_02535 [Actinomycetes bacterium]|nr:hypothetical protein [Actinomycetes bacterium]
MAISAALTANETASARNGAARASENSRPPRGGPAKWSPTVWAAAIWLLARSSRTGSRETIDGTIDWAAGVNSVPPVASRNPATPSGGMLTQPPVTATASAPTTRPR